VLADADWIEASPLGRAEWLKVFAALTGTEGKATAVYGGIKKRYTAVAQKVADAKPATVLPGNLRDGTWSMPAGGSYVGTLLHDAGGTYPWADNQSTGSLTLDFESVYAKDGDAKYWLVNDPSVKTVTGLLAQNSHYHELAAATAGQVWNATKRVNASGGNDYFEGGVLHPDRVLADLAEILHPKLFPGRSLAYYVHLPQN
jgi:iron complex transport system substrate-binding protein